MHYFSYVIDGIVFSHHTIDKFLEKKRKSCLLKIGNSVSSFNRIKCVKTASPEQIATVMNKVFLQIALTKNL